MNKKQLLFGALFIIGIMGIIITLIINGYPWIAFFILLLSPSLKIKGDNKTNSS